jgi:AcrR family transcriptional regulator
MARSFIDMARRAQIIGAAIETISSVGFGHASLARIADRVGISKGVISYHFAGKDELIREVVAEVYATADAFIRPRVEAEGAAADRLRAYITSEIAFLRLYPMHLRAVVEIITNFRDAEGKLGFDSVGVEMPRLAIVEEILRSGQQTGEFRDFSTWVMAVAVIGSVDGVLARWLADPDLDLETCARELAEIFDLATRRG